MLRETHPVPVIPWVVPLTKTTGILAKAVRRKEVQGALLEGTVLVIDPSSGSFDETDGSGSLPGYAIYHRGVLHEAGVVAIPPCRSLRERLWQIGQVLRGELQSNGGVTWDALILEKVPPMRFGRFGRGSAKRQLPLHYSIGLALGTIDAAITLEVTPQTWHRYVAPTYVKGDDKDAIVMGHVLIEMARAAAAPRSRKKKTKKKSSRKRRSI
jgi:hypothetical protein